jgi:hypothetical protein
MKVDLSLLYGAIERTNCGVTTLGTLARDLRETNDESAVAAIGWLFEVLRDEIQNLRETVELLDETLKGSEVQP